MARKKEFDPDKAVELAAEVFLNKGYEATSVSDLIAHMGISRSSFYDTFGSKKAVYLAALERFSRTEFDYLTAALTGHESPSLTSFQDFLNLAVDNSISFAQQRGHLGINALNEMAPVDRDIRQASLDYFGWYEALLIEHFSTLQKSQVLREDADPRRLARFSLFLLIGMFSGAKLGLSQRELKDIADVLSKMLQVF